jgi:hypothetical protein
MRVTRQRFTSSARASAPTGLRFAGLRLPTVHFTGEAIAIECGGNKSPSCIQRRASTCCLGSTPHMPCAIDRPLGNRVTIIGRVPRAQFRVIGIVSHHSDACTSRLPRAACTWRRTSSLRFGFLRDIVETGLRMNRNNVQRVLVDHPAASSAQVQTIPA